MASSKENPDPHYRVLLLGKTGAGISASGNTILKEKAFMSKKVFKSLTQEVQMKRAVFNDVTLDVYDTPGLFNPESSNHEVLEKWNPLLHLDESICTVVLLVIKIDRFTQEDKEAVNIMEGFLRENLIQNTWILFTRGDELERENLSVKQFIEDTEEIKELVQRFQGRYHVFNNISQNTNQVTDLIHKIKASAQIVFSEIKLPDAEDPLHRRIVLLGKTGVGKSATGNTILGEERFKSEISPFSVTSKTELQQNVVLGRTLSVIDTPGLFDTKLSREELSEELGRSIFLSSPGPHVFLYVQPVNIRFTEQEENVIEKLEETFGKDMKKYTILLFTHGDQLKGTFMDVFIQKNKSLHKLVQQCGGGYHLFNNEDKNQRQVRELLQKIDTIVEMNKGNCYSNNMYEEAARIKREKGFKGFKEFYIKNKKHLIKAAGLVGGSATGSIIGAALGAIGGPLGVAIGAGIGAVVGAGIVPGIGITAACVRSCTGTGKCKSGEQMTSDDDGDSTSLELMSPEEDVSESSLLINNSSIRQRSSGGRSQYQK